MLRGKKLAILGTGNIGGVLLGGLLNAKLADPDDIIATALNDEHLADLADRFGVRTSSDNRFAVESAEIVLLCVKPVTLPQVLEEIRDIAAQRQRLYISVAAGI